MKKGKSKTKIKHFPNGKVHKHISQSDNDNSSNNNDFVFHKVVSHDSKVKKLSNKTIEQLAISLQAPVLQDKSAMSNKIKMSNHGKTELIIKHPLAKYNSLNQLVCIVCGIVVKNSNSLWEAHLSSLKHKNNAISFRSTKTASETKLSGKDPSALSASGSSSTTKSSHSLLSGDYDSDHDDNVKNPQQNILLLEKPEETDVQDPEISTSVKPKAGDDKASALPEGFFDDPVVDAKVRHVPYKEKMDEELELFTKEIQQVQSEAMQNQETTEEESDVLRNLDEIAAQEDRWHRIDKLDSYLRQAVSTSTAKESTADDNNTSDDDMDDVDIDEELLSWRKKHT